MDKHSNKYEQQTGNIKKKSRNVEILYKTNKYQTPIDTTLKQSVSEKVFSDLIEFIQNVKWIERLITPDRKRAKDLDRDHQGKIIVDLENPHIL
jgi:hypothetical protein